ncbi:hypothetical protein J1N35_038131 [Gossypium stocksii]|uniref:Uncharacterized protein n=1 Tax=Gossypium stocksii TaxID=47602 RepID=A0A9D3ULG7_9ROSI|nr:hypothetical protein J1N35_038131 [Gossypium stocksii]
MVLVPFPQAAAAASNLSTPPPKQHQTGKQLADASKVRPPVLMASTMVLQPDSQASAVSTSLTRSALALTATGSYELFHCLCLLIAQHLMLCLLLFHLQRQVKFWHGMSINSGSQKNDSYKIKMDV